MANGFAVAVAAGSLRSTVTATTHLPHQWTDEGVAVDTAFTGAHLLHLAVAACVLNDLYRESQRLGVALDGVRVEAGGGFDTEAWCSTGVTYRVEVDSPAAADDVARLVAAVDEVAEIPKALRAGAEVRRAV
jgi:uncharacterized OsmC-like protein